MEHPQRGSVVPALLGSVWLVAAGFGYVALSNYHLSPSKGGGLEHVWPVRSAISPHPKKLTLVMFLHPHCACSKASLSELERLLARVQDELHTVLLFAAESDNAVETTALWLRAAKLPGVITLKDPGGNEASKFGSLTSGEIALYDARGILHFQGGITASRGHEGDNIGARSILKIVREHAGAASVTPVFGCGLVDSGEGDRV